MNKFQILVLKIILNFVYRYNFFYFINKKMKEIELLLPFGILLNIFQIAQILIFIRFSICKHFNIKKFLILYTLISFFELIIMGYILSIVHRKKEIETEKEENTILSSLGIYLFIKFLLVLCESSIENTLHPFSRTKIYIHCVKFIKTFAAMNSFVTVLLEKTNITKRPIKITFMILFPLLLYGFFLGTNQLILFFRRRYYKGYRILENNSIQQNNAAKPQNQKRIFKKK